MASGSFSVSTTNSNISGTLSWSSTDDVANNRSTVTATLRLSRTNSGYTTYGDGTFYIKIDGTTYSGSVDSGVKISYNSNTLIMTASKTVSHNSDGTKSITISTWGSHNAGFSISTQSGTAKLDNIPRASSISSSANWTAGYNLSISVSRASTSFTHIARVYVNGVQVYATPSGSKFGTSVTATLDHGKVFAQLAGGATQNTEVQLDTYNGSTKINTTTVKKTGTVTAPSASTAKITNPTGISNASGQGASTVWIDQSVSIAITRNNTGFTHTLRFRMGNTGTIIHEKTGVTTSYTWTPSASEKTVMYNNIPNDVEFDGQLDIITYYGSTQVRSTTNIDINYRARNSEPTFGSTYTFKDSNTTVTAITGNNQYIVQNKSNLVVEIPTTAKATPNNGSSIVSYSASINGVTKTAPFSSTATVSIDLGTVSTNSNATLTVKAIDSRGFETAVSKAVTIVPYSNPVATVTAVRLNNFEASTTITLKGSCSSVNIGGTNKNAIVTAKSEYKETTSSTYGGSANFTVSGFPSYTATNRTVTLNNLKSYDVRVTVTDKFGTTTVIKTVATGQPILFMDSDKKAIGINMFPRSGKSLDVEGIVNISGSNGQLEFDRGRTNVSRIYWNASASTDYGIVFQVDGSTVLNLRNAGVSALTGDLSISGTLSFASSRYASEGGAINLKNSDMLGVNNIFMNDVADSAGEGLQWMRTDTPSGSYSNADYDTLRVLDGSGRLNNKVIFTSDDEILWSGGLFMSDTHTVTPSKKLSDCPNGWVLVWSEFKDGEALSSGWQFSYIPKKYGSLSAGGSWQPVCGTSGTTTLKYIYCSDTQVKGHARNDDAPQNTAVLRHVLSF